MRLVFITSLVYAVCHKCGRPGLNHRELTDAQKEAFTRWKEAGYAKSAAAERATQSQSAVPGPEGTQQPKAPPALAAAKPRAKAKSICIKFLKGECNEDKCPMTHSKSIRNSLVGATITSAPAKQKKPSADGS